jgi:hypothetical protein
LDEGRRWRLASLRRVVDLIVKGPSSLARLRREPRKRLAEEPR